MFDQISCVASVSMSKYHSAKECDKIFYFAIMRLFNGLLLGTGDLDTRYPSAIHGTRDTASTSKYAV